MTISVCLFLIIAAFAFWLGKRIGQWSTLWSGILLGISLIVCVGHIWYLGNDLFWAQLLPHPSVIILSNLPLTLLFLSAGLMLGKGCTAGCQADHRQQADRACIPAWRMYVSMGILGLTAVIGSAMVFLRPLSRPVELRPEGSWKQGVCLQTQESSCTAAAAATLLWNHGIVKSEQAMARDCLTSLDGTLALGAFHGLCRATSNSPLHPQAVTYGSHLPSAAELELQLPMLAHVSIDRFGTRPSKFLGMQLPHGPNVGHTVVILKRLEYDNWLIADPAIGPTVWSNEQLRKNWFGEGIFLKDAGERRSSEQRSNKRRSVEQALLLHQE